MKIKPKLALAASAALGLGLSACSDSSLKVDIRQDALISLGDGIIMPGFREFESRTQALSDGASAACRDGDFEQVKDAWSSARMPWKELTVLAFGPFRDEPLRLGPKIDFWPTRPDLIDDLLDSELAINMESVGAAAMGMPAIEYILFAGEASTQLAQGTRHCELLQTLTGNLSVQAAELRRAWDPSEGDYLSELTHAGEGDYAAFDSIHDALGELVSRMGFTLEDIRNDKLGAPLGDTSGGSPQPLLAESPYSGRSIEDLMDTLAGIRLFYFGIEGGLGIASVAERVDSEYDELFRQKYDEAAAALRAIPEPLSESIVSHPEHVRSAVDALGELQTLIQVDIVGALGLAPRFNDSDGD